MSLAHQTSIEPPLTSLTHKPTTVLLVDDQAIVGEAVRRMLAAETDLEFHFCSNPSKALEKANEIGPTVILQDLVMPEIDGLTLVKFFRANPKTKDVPLIVLSTKEEPTIKAQAFTLGANDYLVKLPDKLELIARVRYHSKGYINLLERNEAYHNLQLSQKHLADEVGQAARYLQSLLPEPLVKGDIRINWRFIPSTQLGGDAFGYHWLDPDHFAMFLLDVSGHGVGASLLSVSALNVITSQSLPNTDFRDPSQVLRQLNLSFQMEKHDNKFFTIWYAVYHKKTRKIAYCGAGHPASILLTGEDRSSAKLQQLESKGPIIGAWPDYDFETQTADVGPFARLVLYSDGVFEVSRPDGTMWEYDEYVQHMDGIFREGDEPLDPLIAYIRQLHGSDSFADDFSIVQVAL